MGGSRYRNRSIRTLGIAGHAPDHHGPDGRAPDGRILIIDEVHTPDSSRYWIGDTYKDRIAAGQEPENFDKEFVRLEYAAHGYRGDGEPPEMPADLWIRVAERYITLFEKLTGTKFEAGAYPVGERLAGII